MVPMSRNTILVDKVVLIENGIIGSFSDSISTEDIPVIDAENRYLSPGLIDMHVQRLG